MQTRWRPTAIRTAFRSSFTSRSAPPRWQNCFAPTDGQPTALHHRAVGATLVVNAGKYSSKIFGQIDGERTFQQIFDLVLADPACRAAPPDNATLLAGFRESFDALNAIERLLLRHVSCR